MTVGDVVNVHSPIDRSITSTDHIITHIEHRLADEGEDIVWITGKSQFVLSSLLSRTNEAGARQQTLQDSCERRISRYQAFKLSKTGETYFEWVNNPEWDTFRLRLGC